MKTFNIILLLNWEFVVNGLDIILEDLESSICSNDTKQMDRETPELIPCMFKLTGMNPKRLRDASLFRCEVCLSFHFTATESVVWFVGKRSPSKGSFLMLSQFHLHVARCQVVACPASGQLPSQETKQHEVQNMMKNQLPPSPTQTISFSTLLLLRHILPSWPWVF